jgi:hypothetical protein
LSFYDYKASEETLFDKENEEEILGRCLAKIQGVYQYVRGNVVGYDEQKAKYMFRFTHDGQQKEMLVPRLYVCLDFDSPAYYCERFSKAFFTRIYADNLIKFRFYVESMPTESLSKIDEQQKGRIINLV